MSGDADTMRPVARGSTCGLLVVVEPSSEGKDVGTPALISEGVRLARELDSSMHAVTWPAREDADLQPVATAVGGLVEDMRPLAVLLADTDIGRQLAPMVAHVLDSAAIVGCSDVRAGGDGPVGYGECGTSDSSVREARGADGASERATLAFVKPVFGGWLEREVEAASGVIPVVTLDLTGVEEPDLAPEGLPAPHVLQVESTAQPRVRCLEVIPPDPRSVDLVHARRIVAAGAGSASDELLAAVGELAELLEGSVGTTRPVVDDGRLPKERLIGQTGKTVTPDLYLALGISGSPHHLAGVTKADRIVSINRDIRAPIFQFSDVGYVADLESVLPGLVRKIKEWRDAPDGSE